MFTRLFCILFGYLPFTLGVETNITLPIKDGVDVAVLIFPGAYLTVDQYEQLGLDLQEQSNTRMWLTFTGDFPGDLVNPFAMIEGFEQALALLEQNGFPPGSPIFAAGHSLAGVFIYSVALDFPDVTGVIMWAAYFSGDDMVDYPRPALTLSGDIDGQTLITTIATSFQQLEELVAEDPERVYNTPVILLQDVNHGIYATGDLPPRVEEQDIPSPLGGAEGRALIAEATDAFISAQVLDGEDREAARFFLAAVHNTTRDMVQPMRVKFCLSYTMGSGQSTPKPEKPKNKLRLLMFSPSPTCRTVMLTSAFIGIQLEYHTVNIHEGAHMDPEFLLINHDRTIPVLKDGSFILWQSRAISKYLINRYATGHSLYPLDPLKRATIDKLLDWDLEKVYTAMTSFCYPQIFQKVHPGKKSEENMRQVLTNLELKLQGKRFLAGENITLANVSVMCNLSLLEMVPFDVSPWPRFLQWRDDIKATGQYKIVHEGFVAFKKAKLGETGKADAKRESHSPKSPAGKNANTNAKCRLPTNEGAPTDGTNWVTVVPS